MIKKFAFLHTILFEKKIKNAWIHINLRLIKSCNIFKNTYFSYNCNLNSVDYRNFKLGVRMIVEQWIKYQCCVLITNHFRIDMVWKYLNNDHGYWDILSISSQVALQTSKLYYNIIQNINIKYHWFYDRQTKSSACSTYP